MMSAAVKAKILTFRPDVDMFEAMEALKERDGVGYGEQVRRALRQWLVEKDVLRPVKKVKKPVRRTR